MKAQELHDELMELQGNLRNIRYGEIAISRSREAIQLRAKLESFQIELDSTLDNVRAVLRPSIEADIASALPDNEIDAIG